MTSIAVFVQPVAPPPPPVPLFRGGRSTWTGANGRTFDLSDVAGGVVLLEGELEGLEWGPHERFTSESASRPGSRHRGGRDLERPVFWTIGVYSDTSSEAWLAIDREFNETLDRDAVGVWHFALPDGSARELRCRFVNLEREGSRDPIAEGWAIYGVELVAEDPYWYGPAEVWASPIVQPDERPFVDPDTDEVFYVAQATTLATALIANPGDVEAWPVWTIRDDVEPGTILGVGSSVLGVPLGLNPGDELVIDTERQAVTLNGIRVRNVLSPHEFAAVPPRSRTTLTVDITGTGSVECRLVPRYNRSR